MAVSPMGLSPAARLELTVMQAKMTPSLSAIRFPLLMEASVPKSMKNTTPIMMISTGIKLRQSNRRGGISFKKWMKYLAPLFAIWWVIAFIFLAITVNIGYGPF